MNARSLTTRTLQIALASAVLVGLSACKDHKANNSGSGSPDGSSSPAARTSSGSGSGSGTGTGTGTGAGNGSPTPLPTASSVTYPTTEPTAQGKLVLADGALSDHGQGLVSVGNAGDGPLTWSIDYVPSTMTVTPTRGSLGAGETRNIAVSVGAADGDYSYDLKFDWDGGSPVTQTVKGRIEIAPTISDITVKDRTVCANSSNTVVDVRAHITDLGDVSTATLHYVFQSFSGNSSGESYWNMVADSTYYKDATWFVQHGANFPPGRIVIWVVAVDRSGNRRESEHSYVGFVDNC